MFTGIIEEIGVVKSVSLTKDGGSVEISSQKVLEDTKVGDSIAVNGICLTVTSLSDNSFSADVMNETLNRTSFRGMKNGTIVNLERALSLQQRFGGHLVSGHIDGIGTISKIADNGIAVMITIKTEKEISNGIIEKGSIAIDGISLTVVTVTAQDFTVSLIPHTMKETNLGCKKIGSLVNLETDMIGKYIRKFILTEKREEKNLMSLLAENGFL